ncbi:MAG: ATP synthase F1 subunit gamma [Thermoanaerobaculia bacterium]
MANRRVLVKRRKAARNIRKITRTMQLIATARFQSVHSAAVAGRPYTDKLAELVEKLARAASGHDHPLMQTPVEEKRHALLVLSSNRGLCGGYNANVLRMALQHLAEAGADDSETEVHVVGKKGAAYLRFVGQAVEREITDISDSPRFEEVEPLANELMNRFTEGEIDSVSIAYMKFVSAGRQVPTIDRVLPLDRSASATPAESATAAPTHEVDYEFSPEPSEILAELLPATVRVSFFQTFMDAAVSEQIARMVAMKAATDAAGDMIKNLTQQYNRARQTQITMELLDIVGGANALA